KAPHLLLEAVGRMGWNKTRIRLAGPATDPGYAARLRELAGGLNVEFVGPVPMDLMPTFLRSLDVLAVTSLWPENLPFVILEAQAAGVPVVASRMPGMVDQVGNPRMLFESGSAEGLAASLVYVQEQPSSARPMKVCTIGQMTDATESVYNAVL